MGVHLIGCVTQIARKEIDMYIDPNTGGILFQTLAILFGVFSGVVLLFSGKIKMGIAKLRRSMRKETEDTESTESKTE
jgi:hypothetical protein